MDLRADERPDPRLDPYRNRVGILALDGATDGHVLVETAFGQFKTGGALWWTRWADPVEFTVVAVIIDGELVADGETAAGDQLDEQLARWDAGAHVVGPATYRVTWLDQAESDRAHHEVFGHHH